MGNEMGWPETAIDVSTLVDRHDGARWTLEMRPQLVRISGAMALAGHPFQARAVRTLILLTPSDDARFELLHRLVDARCQRPERVSKDLMQPASALVPGETQIA